MNAKIEQLLAQYRRTHADRSRKVAKIVAHCPSGVVLRSRKPWRAGWTLVVHQSTRKPDQWQVTRLDRGEPQGHTEHTNLTAALTEYLVLDGYEVSEVH